jgi:hypothetical protein
MNSDYSCYVTIVNKTNQTLILDSQTVIHGSYKTSPPGVISGGQSITFQLQGSNIGPIGYGGQGECKYKYVSGGNTFWYHFTYSCPHLSNSNSATVDTSPTNLPVTAIPNPIPTGGHPVRIQFILG